jgi:dTDP-glucose pyrophosphorylase
MLVVEQLLISPDTPMLQALQRIEQGAAQIALVVDAGRRLLGTVTDGDVRRAILRGVRLDAPASDIMNSTPLSADESMSQEAAVVLMRDRVIRHLPVLDAQRRVVGLMTLDAVLRSLREDTTVVLMAGGLGSRLQPLTEWTPKPLLSIGGRPLLEITIENLTRQGFGRFLLSVRYKAEMFCDHFGNGQRFGVEIDYIKEEEQLGTAGALRLLPERPSGPIVVMNADILTALDARLLLLFHREQQAPATMCVREYEWKIPYGVVRRSDTGRLAGFEEKPSRREWVNAGIYVLSPEAIDLLPRNGAVDMPTLFERVGREIAPPAVYPLREYWLDIGHLDDLRRAQDDLPGLFQ